MTTKITNIINVVLFLIYSGVLIWCGYKIAMKSVVKNIPTTVFFQGKPDSTKKIPVPVPKILHADKPDSIKTIITHDTIAVHDTLKVHDNLVPVIGKVISYKNYSDSSGNYHIKVVASEPADSIDLTIDHFAMKTIEASTDWKWYVAAGAAAILILEYVFTKIFK